MILFARLVDEDFRVERADYEATVEAPLTKYAGQIADASFKTQGRSTYPDATFTLRLSYGAVKGFPRNGRDIAPVTVLGGAFQRATGAEPFKLPDSWLAAKDSLNLDQPFNFVTTNDIIGGNSGSPVINKAGEVVGLIFDGNVYSLGGAYGYDGAVNRAVAVSVGALTESLAKIYHADRLVGELKRVTPAFPPPQPRPTPQGGRAGVAVGQVLIISGCWADGFSGRSIPICFFAPGQARLGSRSSQIQTLCMKDSQSLVVSSVTGRCSLSKAGPRQDRQIT